MRRIVGVSAGSGCASRASPAAHSPPASVKATAAAGKGRISEGRTASPRVIALSPMAPVQAAACATGVSIQAWPISAQGRPVKIQPRSQSDSTRDAAIAMARRGPRGVRRVAKVAGIAQNSAPPPAIMTRAKGAIQP